MFDNLKNSCIWQLVITLILFIVIFPVAAQTVTEQATQAEEAVVSWFLQPRWSPYIAGTGIGILSWLAFLLSDHPLGCSTAYLKTSGIIGKSLAGNKVTKQTYYQKFSPEIDWEWMLVLGIFIGAFIAAYISGDFAWIWTPSRWAAAFGDSILLRIITALTGGILIGFGSRWARGCTSGHGLSGTLQLAASSLLAVACFFISGIITAMILFKIFA